MGQGNDGLGAEALAAGARVVVTSADGAGAEAVLVEEGSLAGPCSLSQPMGNARRAMTLSALAKCVVLDMAAS
jgi:hypothetical protein